MKYAHKVPLCWDTWFCLSSCSCEKCLAAGRWSSSSRETICSSLIRRKKNCFLNEQLWSWTAVQFFQDPMVSCWHPKHRIFIITAIITPFQEKNFAYFVSHKLPPHSVLSSLIDCSLLSMSSVLVLYRHCQKLRSNFCLSLVSASQLGYNAMLLATCTCCEVGFMEESAELWEIWPWCFPLVHNHVHKTLTSLIFLFQLSSKVPRMMVGMKGRYDPVAINSIAACPITLCLKR